MAFKMRSGNGPLAFKNMGSSSPAKQSVGFGSSEADKKAADKEAADKKAADKLAADELAAKKLASAKERKEYASTKHKGQLKKEARLAEITEKRRIKGKEGKTSRQIRLQAEVDKTPEQYAADRKQKNKEAIEGLVAGLREYGPGGSGSQAEGWQKYKAGKEQRESQRISDARTEQLIERQRQIDDESNKVKGDELNATGENGDPNFVKTVDKLAKDKKSNK